MKFLKNKKWVRPFILVFTTIAVIILVTVGSIYGIGNPSGWIKSKEYGRSVKVITTIKANSSKTKVDYNFAKKVADQIDSRVNVLSLKSPKIQIEQYIDQASKKIHYRIITTVSGIKNDDEKDKVTDLISDQPILSIYNTGSKGKPDTPLLTKAGYNKNGDNVPDEKLPFWKPGTAKAFLNKRSALGTYEVSIKLSDKIAGSAILDMEKGVASKEAVIWLGHDVLEKKVMKEEPDAYKAQDSNLFAFMHVNGVGPDNKPLSPTLKENQYDASNFLITAMQMPPAPNIAPNTFVIGGNFSKDRAESVASRINFGLQDYTLTENGSFFVQPLYGKESFNRMMIAGSVVIALIAVFMIVNYGLLGMVSTISMALYIFLTLLMFTIMRGEYSPVTVGAILLGVGLSIGANIITFERLKSEVYKGFSISKSIDKTNRSSLITVATTSIALIIIAFSLFYFGTRSIKGFSVMLILSIIFTMGIMILFTKILSTNLVKTGIFKKHMSWLGIYKSKLIPKDYEQAHIPSYQKINFVKHAKWYHLSSAILIVTAVITFTITAAISASFAGGMNTTFEYKSGIRYEIKMENSDTINATEEQKVKNYFESLGVESKNITALYRDSSLATKDLVGLNILASPNVLKHDSATIAKIDKDIKSFFKTPANVKISNGFVTNVLAKQLIKNAIIAIAITLAALILFVLIRFNWTFALSMLIAFVHDGLIISTVFIIFRLPVNTLFIIGLLASLAFSINNMLIFFDRVRNKMNEKEINIVYNRKTLSSIANSIIGKQIKRSLVACSIMIMSLIVFIAIEGTSTFSFNFALIIGIIVAFFTTPFISGYLWVFFETIRSRRMKLRKEKNFWKTKGVEEEIIQGINDFKI